jgi:hypothetical protein
MDYIARTAPAFSAASPNSLNPAVTPVAAPGTRKIRKNAFLTVKL